MFVFHLPFKPKVVRIDFDSMGRHVHYRISAVWDSNGGFTNDFRHGLRRFERSDGSKDTPLILEELRKEYRLTPKRRIKDIYHRLREIKTDTGKQRVIDIPQLFAFKNQFGDFYIIMKSKGIIRREKTVLQELDEMLTLEKI